MKLRRAAAGYVQSRIITPAEVVQVPLKIAKVDPVDVSNYIQLVTLDSVQENRLD